eukprot:1967480-Rhodomonas_salina.1
MACLALPPSLLSSSPPLLLSSFFLLFLSSLPPLLLSSFLLLSLSSPLSLPFLPSLSPFSPLSPPFLPRCAGWQVHSVRGRLCARKGTVRMRTVPPEHATLGGQPGLQCQRVQVHARYHSAPAAPPTRSSIPVLTTCAGQGFSPRGTRTRVAGRAWGGACAWGGTRRRTRTTKPYLFIECNPPEFCAEQFRCEAGHTGRLCLVPAHGWFVLGKRYYLRCGADGQATSSFLILAVFFIWFLMNKVASGNYDALDIGLLFVQITGTPSYLQPPFFPRWGGCDPRSVRWLLTVDGGLRTVTVDRLLANVDLGPLAGRYLWPLTFDRWGGAGMISSYGLKWHPNLSWLKTGLDI